MVDFHDFAVLVQDGFAVVKLFHTLAGLYIWEFVTTLDFEWSVIRGHRPYRRSIWIYSAARVATLIAVILGLVSLNFTSPYNCQLFATLELTSGYVAIAASSLLIVLRIIAIWNRNRVIVVTALVTWGANLLSVIHGAIQLRSVWVPDLDTCSSTNSTLKLNFIFTLVTDIILLSIMLVGLLRLRCHGSGTFALAHFLWKQGLIWLLLATLAEVPPVVFITLNLNDPLDVMFQLPALLTLSIAATRMHRALVYRASRPVEITKGPTGGDSVLKTEPEQIATVPMQFRQMEVAMDTICEQHATPRTSCGPPCIDINTDGQWPNKPYELRLSLEDDLESGMEKL